MNYFSWESVALVETVIQNSCIVRNEWMHEFDARISIVPLPGSFHILFVDIFIRIQMNNQGSWHILSSGS